MHYEGISLSQREKVEYVRIMSTMPEVRTEYNPNTSDDLSHYTSLLCVVLCGIIDLKQNSV